MVNAFSHPPSSRARSTSAVPLPPPSGRPRLGGAAPSLLVPRTESLGVVAAGGGGRVRMVVAMVGG